MEYKNPREVSDTHLAFYKALELDAKSPDIIQTFVAQLDLRPHSRGISVEQQLSVLIEMGYLERVGQGVRVTPNGRAWGEVFLLRPDGAFILFGSTIDQHAWPAFVSALGNLYEYLEKLARELVGHLTLEHTLPTRLGELMSATSTILRLPNWPDRTLPNRCYHEAAVLACRAELLRLRGHQENLEVRARDHHILHHTRRKIAHLESIRAIPGLAGALTAPKPRVTDFVNIGVIEQQSTGRPTDEKFGILAAPTLFSTDYAETAEACFSRGRAFAVGFVDIDKFKDFNSKHLETVVDRDMLPYFMRALEAYCHGRAIAYRQGGDEYLVLLRNANVQEARAFFEGLRADIARIPYPETIPVRPTVSIGVHVIDGVNEVTVFEAKKLANQAKEAAKQVGRNCVWFSTDRPADGEDEATPP